MFPFLFSHTLHAHPTPLPPNPYTSPTPLFTSPTSQHVSLHLPHTSCHFPYTPTRFFTPLLTYPTPQHTFTPLPQFPTPLLTSTHTPTPFPHPCFSHSFLHLPHSPHTLFISPLASPTPQHTSLQLFPHSSHSPHLPHMFSLFLTPYFASPTPHTLPTLLPTFFHSPPSPHLLHTPTHFPILTPHTLPFLSPHTPHLFTLSACRQKSFFCRPVLFAGKFRDVNATHQYLLVKKNFCGRAPLLLSTKSTLIFYQKPNFKF